MKKLFLVAIAGLFLFASCGNKSKETPVEDPVAQEEGCQKAHEGCCKEMTEEQKADMEAWKDWDNLTPEKKEELVGKRKACIDKMMAEKEGKCEGKKEECPEAEKKCAEFKAKWDNWDNLTIDEKKALLDEMKPHKKCGEHEGCCKGGEKHGECSHK